MKKGRDISMYKVMIVDDEPMVRAGFRQMLAGMEQWILVGEASNGNQALMLLNQLEPDLIFTDIRMPEFDGLQLLEEISRLQIDTLVVLLTGYPDFEYAQRAIRHGAFDYILKPSRAEAIQAVIIKAQNEIQAKRRIQVESLTAAQSASRYQSLTEEKIIRELIYGNYEAGMAGSLSPFLNGLTSVAVMTIHSESTVRDFIQSKPWKIKYFLLPNGHNETLCLMGWTLFDDHQRCITEITDISNELTRSGLSGIRGGIGNVCGLDEAWMSFDQSKMAIQFTSSEFPFLSYNDIMNQSQRTLIFPMKLEAALVENIIRGNKEEVLNILEQAKPHLLKFNLKDLTAHVCQLQVQIVAAINREGTTNLYSADLPQKFPFSDHDEAIGWLEMQINQYLLHTSDLTNNRIGYAVNYLLTHIHDHYATELTLKQLANKLQMNSSYLSVLFKQETTKSFSDYVTYYRIEKAKKLLKSPTITVYAAARQVGYADARHFSQAFKKQEGMSPAEYRKYEGIRNMNL